MNWLFMVVTLGLFSNLFPATIERAFTLARNQDWAGAAAALDQAATEDAAVYTANSFPYLRGRIAENQSDWTRARTEFMQVPSNHPLRPLAAWHAAMAAVQLQDPASAEQLMSELPTDFPAELKVQIARQSTTDLATKIYRGLSTREARFELARINGDKQAFWALLRDRKDDDIGLECAHLLSSAAASPRELMDVADTFTAHRQFAYARPVYEAAAKDANVAAEARYQIARIQFLQEDFKAALETYSSIAKDFAGSSWEKDSDYQIASCYWRLGEYRKSEQAYQRYITRYGSSGQQDGAIRNLVDVYRVLDENQKALLWIDRALAKRLPVGSRQVFLFTKAKVLYTQKKYAAAAALFHQLGVSAIRSTPGNTTKDEARYFEALSLSKASNATAAKRIWRQLASDSLSYYGARSAERLGVPSGLSQNGTCDSAADQVLADAFTDLTAARRPLRVETETATDVVSELMFLQLWDEASVWMDRSRTRPDSRLAAQLAYTAGRYHRSIAYADRLPNGDKKALGLAYPAGFHEQICAVAQKYNTDPLWLHAIIWQESKYNPFARSGASARGLMQFIPETANEVGRAIGISEFSLNKLYDPTVNIPMGAYYFSSLLAELKSPAMALAAYNGGIDNVRRWKSKWPEGDEEFFVSDIGFVETKRYVQAVYGARAAYGSK